MTGEPLTQEPCWRPILSGDRARRAWEAVEAIAADLRPIAGRPPTEDEAVAVWPGRWATLAGGQAGLALFFAYLDLARPDQGYDDISFAALEQAIELMSQEPEARPRLYAGFPGVAWTMEHLQGQVSEEAEEDDDPGADVAEALQEYLGAPALPDENYDLISGIVGLGVYALERLPRPGGRECLEEVVAHLARLAERNEAGTTWLTPHARLTPQVKDRYPEGNYNLGVAHGVPGIVGFLGEALGAGCDVRALLSGVVRWLLEQKLPPNASHSLFSYTVAPRVEPQPARLAWCYGDLGIATALFGAARHAGEPTWEAEALGIARASAARPVGSCGVVDAGLCHGSGGLGHLFNRIYQASGDEAVREAALAWFDWTLDYRKPGEGVGGFLAWDADDQNEMGFLPTPGFLTGGAGVGLALLAGLTSIEPSWDRILLASIPARPEG